MTEQREELIELVIKQIVDDVNHSWLVLSLESLLRYVPDSDLEDFLSEERLRAFWKKYPVS